MLGSKFSWALVLASLAALPTAASAAPVFVPAGERFTWDGGDIRIQTELPAGDSTHVWQFTVAPELRGQFVTDVELLTYNYTGFGPGGSWVDTQFFEPNRSLLTAGDLLGSGTYEIVASFVGVVNPTRQFSWVYDVNSASPPNVVPVPAAALLLAPALGGLWLGARRGRA